MAAAGSGGRGDNLGEIGFLAPVVQMSETPGRWERAVAPLGSHLPCWLADAPAKEQEHVCSTIERREQPVVY